MPELGPDQGLPHRFAYYKGQLFVEEDGGMDAANIRKAEEMAGFRWDRWIAENDFAAGDYAYVNDEVVSRLKPMNIDGVPTPAGLVEEAMAKFEAEMSPKTVKWLPREP